MNILIIGPSWIGDMVMSQSLYRTLKIVHPDANIDVLAPQWCQPLLQRMPEIRQALIMPLGHGQFDIKTRWDLGRTLKHQYDQAIVLPNSAKSALIPLFAGIAQRRGWKGEMRYGLLNDLRKGMKQLPFMVQRYAALAYPVGDQRIQAGIDSLLWPQLLSTPEQKAIAIARLQLSTHAPIIGLCPGAEFGPAKRWPTEHYARVAQTCIAEGKQIWIFGSAKDLDIANAIRNQLSTDEKLQCIILCGLTSLTEAIDLLASCQAIITNDTGLMHVAAAVNTPIVALYGSSSPRYTPPLAQHVKTLHTDIECRPCFKKTCRYNHLRCLTELEPQTVLDALRTLITHPMQA